MRATIANRTFVCLLGLSALGCGLSFVPFLQIVPKRSSRTHRATTIQHGENASLPSEKESSNDEVKKFLIHKGRSAAMIRRSPSIAGVNLCRGWTPQATEAFVAAVEGVVEMNPILTGHVFEEKRSNGKNQLWIQSGTFPVESHDFVRIVEMPPTTEDLDVMNATELLSYVTEKYVPLLEQSELTSEQIQKRLPLFGATLMLLPDNHALFMIKLSHAVGDGVTFMMVGKKVSLLMSGLDVKPIDWDHPQKATHELYPRGFSSRDIERSYGAPFLIGCLKNVLLQRNRKSDIILLDKSKIHAKKHELRKQLKCDEISSNDVITAALCQACQSSDLFVFTENARGIAQGLGLDAGGNFLYEVPVPREVASRPDRLRQAVVSSKHHAYNNDGLPLQPFICGRVARITSLATIASQFEYDGTESMCMFPYLSFLKDIPLDVAIIFRFNKQYWLVLHNFAKLERSGLFAELID